MAARLSELCNERRNISIRRDPQYPVPGTLYDGVSGTMRPWLSAQSRLSGYVIPSAGYRVLVFTTAVDQLSVSSR